jgi:fumarate hydratase class I
MTNYRFLGTEGVSTQSVGDKTFLQIDKEAIKNLTEIAFKEIMHFLRPTHLKLLSSILSDSEASENDRFVATSLLENAIIAAEGIYPGCQDTGTPIIMAKKGQYVMTGYHDEKIMEEGIVAAYQHNNFRYSQMAPLSMYQEKNTGTNLPAQIDIYATHSKEYEFLFIAKGGGSANKSLLFQQTKSLLNPHSLMKFLEEKIKYLGTAACPPYHLAVVIGGTSAEYTLKMVKLASVGYLDDLPTTGDASGRPFRDLEIEDAVLKMTQKIGIGAQFGGKYFCHDVRVIRLSRHGASCPVGIGVSCSADRQIKAKITEQGIFIEELEHDPAKYLPVDSKSHSSIETISINLNLGLMQVLSVLDKYPIKTRLMLSGKMIVARDIAHAKILEILEKNNTVADYLKNYVIYYAGPAKTPAGHSSGSFGPTTAQRMDPYIPILQEKGASLITLAKGNRTQLVTDSCKQYGGFYLGSIGGPAAQIGRDCIKSVKVLEFPELGMEAIFEITVENFPAFIVVDNKGNDFFQNFRDVE